MNEQESILQADEFAPLDTAAFNGRALVTTAFPRHAPPERNVNALRSKEYVENLFKKQKSPFDWKKNDFFFFFNFQNPNFFFTIPIRINHRFFVSLKGIKRQLNATIRIWNAINCRQWKYLENSKTAKNDWTAMSVRMGSQNREEGCCVRRNDKHQYMYAFRSVRRSVETKPTDNFSNSGDNRHSNIVWITFIISLFPQSTALPTHFWSETKHHFHSKPHKLYRRTFLRNWLATKRTTTLRRVWTPAHLRLNSV